MATMVDRPQSIRLGSSPMIPQRRSHAEIIDVDLLDDDVAPPPTRSVRARVAPPVDVIDISDDEDAESLLPSSSSSRAPFRNPARFRSPPPRIESIAPPPVPTVPPEYASHTSLPMRRNPPPHPRGSNFPSVRPPVRAHDRPFEFEMSFNSGPGSRRSSPSRASGSGSGSRSRSSNHPSRASSPPVVLPPRLGLGGALISSNNARLAEERQLETRRRSSAAHRARQLAHARTIRAARNTGGYGGLGLGIMANDRDQEMTHLYFGLGMMDWPAHLFDTTAAGREEVEYKKEFTHPEKPEAGFTFSFAVDASENTPQADGSQFPTTSVDNPIIIDDDEDTTVPRRDKGKGKAIAPAESSLSLKTLLVCSRCRDPLMLGESASKLGPEAEKDRRIWSLRCGHLIDGKCLKILSTPPDAAPFDTSRKGKGKAPASVSEVLGSSTGSIRSRLRSYERLLPSVSLSSLLGQKNEKRELVEDTFEWECPVASCGRRHTSVKIGGVWEPAKPEMNKGDGVIGVFV
ncbi:hypothetical protein V5O48_003898 [Marasmius crinis-equi]|uniref:Uncharacterized protein n=1 Tax=Marasmius crinis-equi TaxID=585013 RepID=A0ABR3FS22_9AGAR